jgi:hypothetical protein
MRRLWLFPLVIFAVCLVLLTIVQGFSLPDLTAQREKAVAELEDKIAAKMPSSAKEDYVPASPSPVSHPVSPKWADVLQRTGEFLPRMIETRCLPLLSLVFGSWPEEIPRSKEDVDCLRYALGDDSGLIDEIYALCTNTETCYPLHGFNYMSWRYSGEDFYAFNRVMDCTRLLASRAYLNAIDGNALSATRETLAAGNQWKRCPFFFYRDAALIAAIFETVKLLLRQGSPDIENAAKLVAIYDNLQSEQSDMQDFLELTESMSRQLISGRQYRPFPYNVTWWSYTTICRPLYEYDLRQFAEDANQLIDVFDLPYYKALPTLQSVIGGASQNHISRKVSRVTEGLARPFQRVAAAQTTGDILHVAVALARFRQENGEYPGQLDDIKDLLGGTVPLQPFSGSPYGYERIGDAFSLSARVPRGVDELDEAMELTW